MAPDKPLDVLMERIRNIPTVVAIAVYGSTGTVEWTEHSDFDVIAWVDASIDVNSIHFSFLDTSVDLNIKTLNDWNSGHHGWLPPSRLRMIWDPDSLIDLPLEDTGARAIADSYHYRYAHAHRILKLQKLQDSNPVAADLVVAGATHFIAVSYCHARGQRFPGIDKLVEQWRKEDPEMISLLTDSVQIREHRIENIRAASQIALEPSGGLLSPGEVYVTAANGPADEEAKRQAREIIAHLLLDDF